MTMKSLPGGLAIILLVCCNLAAVPVQAFVPLSSKSTTTGRVSQSLNVVPGGFDPMAGRSGPPMMESGADPTDITLANMFPMDIPMRKMQGGGTVRTWDIPPEAERLYYYIRTNGRPLKAKVELVRREKQASCEASERRAMFTTKGYASIRFHSRPIISTLNLLFFFFFPCCCCRPPQFHYTINTVGRSHSSYSFC
jgi:hypothetical protein